MYYLKTNSLKPPPPPIVLDVDKLPNTSLESQLGHHTHLDQATSRRSKSHHPNARCHHALQQRDGGNLATGFGWSPKATHCYTHLQTYFVNRLR